MPTVATGKVEKLFAQGGMVVIMLDIPSVQQSLSKEFRLLTSHKNYNSLLFLVLTAWINGHDLTIGKTTDIVSTQVAFVLYLVVE